MLHALLAVIWSYVVPGFVMFIAGVSAFATGPTNYLSVSLVLCALAGVGCAVCVFTKSTIATSSPQVLSEELRMGLEEGDVLFAHWSLLSTIVTLVHYVESYRCDVFAAGAPVVLMVMCGPGSATVVMATTLIASLNASPVIVGLKRIVPVSTLAMCCALCACVCAGAQREAGDVYCFIRHVALLLPFAERWYQHHFRQAPPPSNYDAEEENFRKPTPSALQRVAYVLLFALVGGAALFSWGRVVVLLCREVTLQWHRDTGDANPLLWTPQAAHILLDTLLCGGALMAVLAQPCGSGKGDELDLPDVVTAAESADRKKVPIAMLVSGPAAAIALYWALRETNASIAQSPTCSSGGSDPFVSMSPMSPMIRRRRSSGSSGDDRPAFLPFDSQRVDRRTSTFDVPTLDETSDALSPPQDALVIPPRRRRSSEGQEEIIMMFSSPRTATRLGADVVLDQPPSMPQPTMGRRSSSVDSLMG